MLDIIAQLERAGGRGARQRNDFRIECAGKKADKREKQLTTKLDRQYSDGRQASSLERAASGQSSSLERAYSGFTPVLSSSAPGASPDDLILGESPGTDIALFYRPPVFAFLSSAAAADALSCCALPQAKCQGLSVIAAPRSSTNHICCLLTPVGT